MWSGITRDRTSIVIIIYFVLFQPGLAHGVARLPLTIISPLTSAKTDVSTAVEAAESAVETVNIREAGTPAGGLSVGAQLDGRQDADDGAGVLAGAGAHLLLKLNPVWLRHRQSCHCRDCRDCRAGRDLRTERRLFAADIELAGGGVHTLLEREGKR